MSYPLLEINLPRPFDQMYQELIASTEKTEQATGRVIDAARLTAQVCFETLIAVKNHVIEEGFADHLAEIRFFKHVKPLFARWHLYYQELYEFEKRKPVGGKEAEIHYLQKKLLALQGHYEEHAELYQYLRENATHQDELYYLRQQSPNPISISTAKADADPRFSTPMDSQTAEILKNALMEEYILRAMNKIGGASKENSIYAEEDDLFWTGPVNGLGLLLRTLVKAGYINNGNVAMTKVVERTERFLHVNMNNFNRAIQETRIKKDPFEFLKGLIKVSQADFNNLDDNPRYM
ncbi:MAG: hypothetical protein BGO55_08735 [Sphingobacteriales bacterium 50-39]|nr:RteC domain-containing protein [Sphingobacteriales bacterium]OJW59348.1 MAG: hypothetical protein BGO55_08735 [Sphingobacteriales bacterium 50-39]